MNRKPRMLAIHLPQFHPIPENDDWWGRGFTEWFNVAAAKPLFPGHDQPRIPADLGFYDLRVPETREAQANLAREHGIEGFCHYHYWFNGHRLLDRPVREILQTQRPDFPFCLCWANESWSRRWLGEDRDILMAQTYSETDNIAHARHLAAVFCDRRYIRVGGRPLFIIYRPAQMNLLAHFAAELRAQSVLAGAGEPLLLGCSAHAEGTDMRTLGLDGTLDFQPKLGFLPGAFDDNVAERTRRNRDLGVEGPAPRVYAADALRAEISRFRAGLAHPVYPSVFVSWDNTPRRGEDGTILLPRSPESFRQGLRDALDYLDRRGSELAEPLLFINAWNEWAEGNYLEPDTSSGRSHLAELGAAIAANRSTISRATVPALAAWPAEAAAILATIKGPATLKLCVKVLEEPAMLRGWIEHHAKIVGLGNLIVVDTGSRSPESMALYAEYEDRVTIFHMPGGMEHLHGHPAADPLYAQLHATCDFFAFLDCDERLVMLTPASWSADAGILEFLRQGNPGQIVPTTWLTHHVNSDDAFQLPGGGTYRGLEENLKWGKPVLPSAMVGLESGIHNIQHQGFRFTKRDHPLLFVLHFCCFPAQRIEANRKKLLQLGRIDPSWSVEEILAADYLEDGDPTQQYLRYIREIAEMRDYREGKQDPDLTTHIRLAPDGTVVYSGQDAKTAVEAYFRDWEILVRRSLGTGSRTNPECRPYAPSAERIHEVMARCRADALAPQVRLLEDRLQSLTANGEVPDPQWRAEAGILLIEGGRLRRSLQRIPCSAPPTQAHLGELNFPNLNAVHVENVTVKGADMIFVNGAPTFWRGIHPPYAVDIFPLNEVVATGQEARTSVHLTGPAAHLGQWTSHIYGHFLLEMLPKVVTFLQMKTAHPDLKLVVSDWATERHLGILKLFVREDDLLIYDAKTQQVEAATLFLLPSFFQDMALHPALERFLEMALSLAAPPRIDRPRIFISKSKWRSTHGQDYRCLENEVEVQEFLEERGFVTVFPEALPWPDQVSLFAGAEVIVGEFSSALHNTIFSPPGSIVIGLNYINEVQDCIASYAGHKVGYVLPEDGRPRIHDSSNVPPGYRIRVADLERLLESAI